MRLLTVAPLKVFERNFIDEEYGFTPRDVTEFLNSI